jgi:uncharacterized membrane protein YqgA involved in biofilm formation
MLGPIVNASAIVIASLVGYFFGKRIPLKIEEIIRKVMALFVIYIGIKGAFDNQRIILMLLSLTIGAVIGELIDIDGMINRLGGWAEKRLGMSGEERSFSKAFVSTTILYCTGSIVIVGSLQSGLTGSHEILFMKSVLDAVASLVFTASLGIGVLFSAIPVFISESALVLGAMAAKDFLTDDITREMSAVGSVIVAGLGFNFLGVKEIKVANLIPAIFIPLLYMTLEGILKG